MSNLNNQRKTNLKLTIYGILVSALVLAIALIVAFSTPSGNNSLRQDDNPPAQETTNTPIVFASPLEDATVLMGFSATALQFNSTLRQWEAHKAIDFSAVENANVMAVYDGVVESVKSSYLMGTTITIKHNDKLSTVYASLDSEPTVKEGDQVKKGQIIGKVASNNQAEANHGAHLHFEVLENGAKVDPAQYLTIENK